MKKRTIAWLAGGGALVAGGAFLYLNPSAASTVGKGFATTFSGCSGTVSQGLTAVYPAQYTPYYSVNGPSPGPEGQHEFPCLWAVAPKSLPVNGYQGGPAITRPNGQVWVVIATNMAVTGTFNGQAASGQGPWNGIAEYSNGALVRVYPQQGTASLGSWSGGY